MQQRRGIVHERNNAFIYICFSRSSALGTRLSNMYLQPVSLHGSLLKVGTGNGKSEMGNEEMGK